MWWYSWDGEARGSMERAGEKGREDEREEGR